MQTACTIEDVSARTYPAPVAIAIAKDARGVHNPITLVWMMQASEEPVTLAISVGLAKHSLEAIRGSRQFVVAYPSTAMADDTLFFGTHSGRDTDKLATRGARTQPAAKIDSVLLSDAVVNYECELESEVATGNHVVFIGRVVAIHGNTDPEVRCLQSYGFGLGLGGVTKG